MMVIGPNTPAMIKAMTTEVESKNFIIAPLDPCVERTFALNAPLRRKLAGRNVDRPQPYGPRLPPAFAPS